MGKWHKACYFPVFMWYIKRVHKRGQFMSQNDTIYNITFTYNPQTQKYDIYNHNHHMATIPTYPTFNDIAEIFVEYNTDYSHLSSDTNFIITEQN